MFGKKKKQEKNINAPKSTTKEAKKLIRSEALSIFTNDRYSEKDKRTRIERMKDQADASYSGYNSRYASNYSKGKQLVDDGNYRVYYDDQADFLKKIYGKKTVESWSGNKIHATYAHLIAREYEAMLREDEKKKASVRAAKKARTSSKPKTAAAKKPARKTTTATKKPTRAKTTARKPTVKKSAKK